SLSSFEAPIETTAEKIAALDAIRRWAKTDSALDPYVLADEVWKQLGITELEMDVELDRKLAWDDVRTLASHPLFVVGGHGASHRILAHLGERGIEREVDESLDRLDDEVGRPTRHFSYPEGGPGTWSETVI